MDELDQSWIEYYSYPSPQTISFLLSLCSVELEITVREPLSGKSGEDN